MFRSYALLLALAAPAALAQTPPQVLARTAPVLPDTSQVRGTVGLTVLVDTLGQPMRIRVATPLRPDADSAAVRAVWRWRFAPARTPEGAPQPAALRVVLAFEAAPAPETPVPALPPLPGWAQAFSTPPDLVFLDDTDPRPDVDAPEWRSTGPRCTTVTAPQARDWDSPFFSDAERRGRDSLRFVTALRLDAQGRVAEALVVSSDDARLSDAFRRATLRHRYTPATCDGTPRTAALLVPSTIHFYSTSVRTRSRGY